MRGFERKAPANRRCFGRCGRSDYSVSEWPYPTVASPYVPYAPAISRRAISGRSVVAGARDGRIPPVTGRNDRGARSARIDAARNGPRVATLSGDSHVGRRRNRSGNSRTCLIDRSRCALRGMHSVPVSRRREPTLPGLRPVRPLGTLKGVPSTTLEPAPDLFLHAAARMGVDPKTCTVVEDSAVGVRIPAATGMRTIGSSWGSCRQPACRSSAKPRASAVVSDMRALKTAIVDLRGWQTAKRKAFAR